MRINRQQTHKDRMQSYKELAWDVFEKRVNLNDKIVFLTGDIEEGALEDIQLQINLIRDYNPELTEVTLQINSAGGDVYEMCAIIDYMKTLSFKVNTFCVGKALSAAGIILALGTGERLITPLSTVMMHESYFQTEGKMTDIQNTFEHFRKLENNINILLAERSNKTEAYWKKIQKNDVYINAHDAKSLGIVDRIIQRYPYK